MHEKGIDENLTRRRILLVGAAATTGLMLPIEAGANPIVWRAAKWLGGVVVSWAAEKLLDAFWDRFTDAYWGNRRADDVLKYVRSTPDPAPNPAAVRDGMQIRFHQKVIETRLVDSDGRYFKSAVALPLALRTANLDPSHMVTNWGAATSEAVGRDLDDGGILRGQWWGTSSEPKRRYVITRTFYDQRIDAQNAALCVIKNNAAFEHEQFVLGNRRDPAGNLVKQMIEDPEAYVKG